MQCSHGIELDAFCEQCRLDVAAKEKAALGEDTYIVKVRGLDATEALRVIMAHEKINCVYAIGVGGPCYIISAKDRDRLNAVLEQWKYALRQIQIPI